MKSHAVLNRQDLIERYRRIRATSLDICEPLEIEDYVIQTCENVSPPKWHLAHTSWFFETFVLEPFQPKFRPYHRLYKYLFNSYYVNVGDRHPRPTRGSLSRPTVRDVKLYRAAIDAQLTDFLEELPAEHENEVLRRVELGLHHEQQHQELLLMDIKHILSVNPTDPVYRSRETEGSSGTPAYQWHELPGGLKTVGHDGEGFSYDNERPEHRVFLPAFALSSRCVTNGEYLEWIEAGAYDKPQWWLSDGWATVERESWKAPLYWRKLDGEWYEFTLAGLRQLKPDDPVVHVSYFEATAYAAWRGARLPTEFEWQVAASDERKEGNFFESGVLHPRPAGGGGQRFQQLFGDVWEITSSAYSPFPGYRAEDGALGEYNGKFMSGQIVFKGGSCLTAQNHVRSSYRNFFYPHERWAFSGLRLAKDLEA